MARMMAAPVAATAFFDSLAEAVADRVVEQLQPRPSPVVAKKLKEPEYVALPAEGFISIERVLQVMGDMGKSTWTDGVRSGIYPQPVQISPGRVGWDVRDIRELIDRLKNGALSLKEAK